MPRAILVDHAEYRARLAVLERVRNGWGTIPRGVLRDVVRVSAFWFQAMQLRDEDRRRAARIKFVTSTGEIMCGPDTVIKYELGEIQRAFFDRVRYWKSCKSPAFRDALKKRKTARCID